MVEVVDAALPLFRPGSSDPRRGGRPGVQAPVGLQVGPDRRFLSSHWRSEGVHRRLTEGGDTGIEIVRWACGALASIPGGTVQIGADGTAVLTFTVTRAALGRDPRIGPVQWGASAHLGIVGGITSVSIPAGGGPVAPAGVLWSSLLATAGSVAVERRLKVS